jgi:hypothetical protein
VITTEPDPQDELLEADDQRILVTGGPGSGKTATALRKACKILEGQPRPVLFLTFSRTAIGEIATRVPGVLSGEVAERLELQTFHAFAASILNNFARYAGRGREPINVLTDVEFDIGIVTPGAIKYKEIIPSAIAILHAWPWLLDRYQRRYAAVFSDEYQDTGDRASELLELIAERTQIICLADERQMIYDWQNEGQERRVATFRARPHRHIDLGERSFRDPTRQMPRLATALQQERFADPVVAELIEVDRFGVVRTVGDVLDTTVAEIRACRAAGNRSVGVFVSQRVLIDELAERLRTAGIEHEIAGLQGASGEAQVAAAAMAAFAIGDGSWAQVMERVAVFHGSSQSKKVYDLARQMIGDYDHLPVGIRRAFDGLRDELQTSEAGSVASFLEAVRPLWRSIFLGKGARLWEIGIDDLRGQTLPEAGRRLADGGAAFLAEVARRQRHAGAFDALAYPPSPIRLMTRHQAKGREMDAIILVHHDIDFEPIGLARRASELRLIYVAVSRARSKVRVVLRCDPMALFRPYGDLIRP